MTPSPALGLSRNRNAIRLSPSRAKAAAKPRNNRSRVARQNLAKNPAATKEHVTITPSKNPSIMTGHSRKPGHRRAVASPLPPRQDATDKDQCRERRTGQRLPTHSRQPALRNTTRPKEAAAFAPSQTLEARGLRTGPLPVFPTH